MADTLGMNAELKLIFTAKNASQVISSARQVDNAVSHISTTAANWDKGLSAATKVVTKRLQELYGVSATTAKALGTTFRKNVVDAAKSGNTLDVALASAIGKLSATIAESELASTSFSQLSACVDEIVSAFMRESGAEAQLIARTEELNAREQQRIAVEEKVAAAKDALARMDGELIARERELNQEAKQQQVALEESARMLEKLATAKTVAAKVDPQLIAATEQFFAAASSGTPILDKLQTSLERTALAENKVIAAETAATASVNQQNASEVQLENTTNRTAATTSRQSKSINQLDGAVNKIISALTRFTEALNASTNALREVDNVCQIARTKIGALGNETEKTTKETRDLGNATLRLPSSFSAVGSVVSGLATQLRSLRSVFSRLTSALRSFINYIWMGAHYIREWVSLSTEFAETNHLMYTTLIHSTGALKATKIAMSDVTDENRDLVVQLTDANDKLLDFGLLMENADYASLINHATHELIRFTDAMMLDPTSIRQVYSAFLGMGDAAGISGSRVIEMSQQMTQLAVNLSSLWDIDIEDAATKLRSALAGNTRAARQLGLDMGRTAANAWLVKNGIDAEYNSLSLADRMTVQYALAMEGAAAAHDDLAKSAMQPANMFRILGQQATKTARLFGNALFPVFTAFIPLVIVLTEALGKLAAALSAFFGRKLGKIYTNAKEQWTSYADNVRFTTRSMSDELADAQEGMDGLGASTGGAAKAAKDFKKQLLGFDEINNLTETEDTGGGGGGGGLGDSIIPDDILADIAKMAQDFGNVRIQIEAAAAEIKEFIRSSKVRPIIDALKQLRDAFFGVNIPLTDAQKKMAKMRGELDETIPSVRHVDGQIDRLKEQWQRFLDLIGVDSAASFFAQFILGISDGITKIQDFIDKLLDLGDTLKSVFGKGNTDGDSFARTLGRIVTELMALSAIAPLLTPLTSVLGIAGLALGSLGGDLAGIEFKKGDLKDWSKQKRVSDLEGKLGKSWMEESIVAERQAPRRAAIAASGGKDISLVGNAVELQSMDETLAKVTSKTDKLAESLTKARVAAADTSKATGGLVEVLEFLKHPIESFTHMGILGKLNVIVLVITTIIEMIKNSPMLQGTLPKALSTIGDLLGSVFTAFDLINTALSPFYAILGNVAAILLDVVIVALEALAGIINWLNETILAPFSEFMLRVTEGLNNGFSEGATTVWDTITGWFISILDWIKNFFGIHSPSAVFSDIGTNMMLGLDEGMVGEEETTQSTIGTILSNLFDKVITWLGEFIPTIPGKILSFLETYVFPNLPGILNNVITFVIRLGADIISTIWEWIKTLPQKIPEWLGIVWNKLNEVLGGWPAKVLQYGKDFITGFWNGINQKVQWVKDKISSAFTAIGDKVKKIFGIASPSKLMAEYGAYVSEGFELGIESGIPSILETVGALATDVSTLMAGGVVDMNSVAESQMTDLNAALSTGITANAQSTLDLHSGDVVGTMQQEIGLLREQNSLLAQILGKDVSVSLDGKQLAASINQASRIQGRPLVYA